MYSTGSCPTAAEFVKWPFVYMLLSSFVTFEELCAYCEKCCLNISWCKHGKWFVMVSGGASELHIMSSPSPPCFLSLWAPGRECCSMFSTPKPLFERYNHRENNASCLAKHSLYL